jgi:DNA repair exonuclease SbcCD ATPase subunit
MSEPNDQVYEDIKRQIDEVEEAYDRRAKTSKENAEKARQGKMEKKRIRDEQKQKEAELKASKKKSKYEVVSSPSVDEMSDNSEDEEYYVFPKKKRNNASSESYMKEIEEMKKQMNELRSKYDIHQTNPIIPSLTPVLPVESKPIEVVLPVPSKPIDIILPQKPKTDSYMDEYNKILKRNIHNYK